MYNELVKIFNFSNSKLHYLLFEAYSLGAFLLAVVLKTNVDLPKNSTIVLGINLEEEFDYSKKCGAQNCPQTKLKGSKATPTDASKFLFYIILIILIVAALVITFLFMENLNAVEQKEKKMSFKIIGQRFKTEIKNLFKIYMNVDIWLMLPLTI